MMPLVSSLEYHSDRVPKPHRLDDWRQLMSATHEVEITEPDAGEFYVDMTLWNLGELVLSSGHFSNQAFRRSPAHIRHDAISHVLFFVQGDGHRLLRTEGRECMLTSGDVLIMEMDRPCWSLASAGSSNSLYLSRNVIHDTLPDIVPPHGLVLRDGASELLAQHVRSLAAHLPSAPIETIPFLTESTKNLALACLATTDVRPHLTKASSARNLRHEIEQFIDHNLEDPSLSPATLCQAFQISRSSLYRLFSPGISVNALIKRRRLHRIRTILMQGSDTRSLATIAEAFGFPSSSHFSRSFHQLFGYAPGQLRTRPATSAFTPAVSNRTRLGAMFS